MKKETECIECGKIAEVNYYCEVCGINLMTKYLGIPITISFGYGSNLDGEEYHFCYESHAVRFLEMEITKNNPINHAVDVEQKEQ